MCFLSLSNGKNWFTSKCMVIVFVRSVSSFFPVFKNYFQYFNYFYEKYIYYIYRLNILITENTVDRQTLATTFDTTVKWMNEATSNLTYTFDVKTRAHRASSVHRFCCDILSFWRRKTKQQWMGFVELNQSKGAF